MSLPSSATSGSGCGEAGGRGEGDRWHHMTPGQVRMTAVMMMTDPRMTTGLEMLSSDQPSSEQSAESRAAPQWSLSGHWCHSGARSLLTLMLSLSGHQAGLHTTGLGHVPLVSGSCLSLSLTAHSSHSSA